MIDSRRLDQGRRSMLRMAAGACWAAMLSAAAQPGLSDEQRSALKQSSADPTLAPDLLVPQQDMAWWRDAKFCVFVHWGLYAIKDGGPGERKS